MPRYNPELSNAPSFERTPRRRPRDSKRDPRAVERDRSRKLARRAKYEMQGREQ